MFEHCSSAMDGRNSTTRPRTREVSAVLGEKLNELSQLLHRPEPMPGQSVDLAHQHRAAPGGRLFFLTDVAEAVLAIGAELVIYGVVLEQAGFADLHEYRHFGIRSSHRSHIHGQGHARLGVDLPG